MESLWDHVEEEFHHAVGYVDRVIVPEARREAGSAARTVARCLDRLADRLDPNGARQANGSSWSAGRQGENTGL
jgi:hypothetical protein